MQEFFNNLYSIENFTLYLIIAIAVLVVLFIIVLFMGKKDQKLEETKRLEKLSLEKNGFKDLSDKVKAETPVVKEEKKKEVVDILLPPIPSPTELKEETPKEETKVEEKKEDVVIEKPILEEIKPEPIKLLNKEETNSISRKEEVAVKSENKVIEPVISSEIKLPELNFDEVINEIAEDPKKEEMKKEESTFKKTELFSSVYAPPKNDNTIDLTNEEIKEEIKVEPIKSIDNEVIDLPKKKAKVGEVKQFDFNNISGETYNIDK